MFDTGGSDQEDGLDCLPDNSVLSHNAKATTTKGSERNSSNHRASKAGRKDDWDEDEQFLWRNSDQSELHASSKGFSSRHSDQASRPLDWVDRGLSSARNSDRTSRNIRGSHFPSPLSSAVTMEKSRTPQEAVQGNLKDDTESPHNFPLRSPPPAEVDSLSQPDSRQHWMPDKLCKQCYSCEATFTVFRRRHHCRICGQVFCNQCSAYFVPHKAGSTVRVCQMCNEQVTERGGLIGDSSDSQTTDNGSNATGSAGITIPLQPPDCADSVHPSLSGSGFDDSVDPASRSRSLRDIETVLQRLSESNVTKRHGDRNHGIPSSESNVPLSSAGASTISQSTSTNAPPQYKGGHGSTPNNHPNPPSTTSASSWIPFTGTSSTASNSRPIVPPPVPSRTSSSGNSVAPAVSLEAVREGHYHLGMVAAEHLENMCDDLLRHHAPLLLNSMAGHEAMKKKWINQLLTLATRCCATVEPNVRKGDLLDIRPYCKIKTIPGGSHRDCAYLSGVVFRKTVSHKRMAREIENPRIMLLSGGIEFTRTENRIASLETLFEQEDKYMEILVGKILKLKPDILMTGRFVR